MSDGAIVNGEPLTGAARDAMVRAQAVAHLFGATAIETEHVAFALAEGDDMLAHLLATAFDRAAMRSRLGVAHAEPHEDMEFSPQTKRALASAFAAARRLGRHHVGCALVALGLLELDDAPPLALGIDREQLRLQLTDLARSETD